MSDTTTPRTDELAMNKSISQEDANELIWVLAKQLERELATATARVKELHGQVSAMRCCGNCERMGQDCDSKYRACIETDFEYWTMKGLKK